jgi:hypothetical protein
MCSCFNNTDFLQERSGERLKMKKQKTMALGHLLELIQGDLCQQSNVRRKILHFLDIPSLYKLSICSKRLVDCMYFLRDVTITSRCRPELVAAQYDGFNKVTSSCNSCFTKLLCGGVVTKPLQYRRREEISLPVKTLLIVPLAFTTVVELDVSKTVFSHGNLAHAMSWLSSLKILNLSKCSFYNDSFDEIIRSLPLCMEELYLFRTYSRCHRSSYELSTNLQRYKKMRILDLRCHDWDIRIGLPHLTKAFQDAPLKKLWLNDKYCNESLPDVLLNTIVTKCSTLEILQISILKSQYLKPLCLNLKSLVALQLNLAVPQFEDFIQLPLMPPALEEICFTGSFFYFKSFEDSANNEDIMVNFLNKLKNVVMFTFQASCHGNLPYSFYKYMYKMKNLDTLRLQVCLKYTHTLLIKQAVSEMSQLRAVILYQQPPFAAGAIPVTFTNIMDMLAQAPWLEKVHVKEESRSHLEYASGVAMCSFLQTMTSLENFQVFTPAQVVGNCRYIYRLSKKLKLGDLPNLKVLGLPQMTPNAFRTLMAKREEDSDYDVKIITKLSCSQRTKDLMREEYKEHNISIVDFEPSFLTSS